MKDINQYLDEALTPFSGFLLARVNMPQIDDIELFEKMLADRGVSTERLGLPVENLKPTQFDYDEEKVERMMADPVDKPVVIASDGFVIDGHHRYHAAYRLREHDIPVVMVDLPINKALALIQKMSEG